MTKEILILIIVLALLTIIGFIGLNIIQKKNRQYERKGVLWYLIISLLVFFILGLAGLLNPSKGIIISQVFAFCFGIFNVWFLFSNYDWSDQKSLLPESILTLVITTITSLGFLLGLWFWPWLFEETTLLSSIYSIIFLIPLPYLFVRTYDFVVQIPKKEYNAWCFPKSNMPKLNLSDSNVVYIYLNVFVRSSNQIEGKINNKRVRLPKDATIGDFFQHFVKDYNDDKHTSYPIANLYQNEEKQSIGWLFLSRRTERGRKILIDPFSKALHQLQEGDFVYAHRVLLGEASTKPQSPLTINPHQSPSSNDDDDIIITEK